MTQTSYIRARGQCTAGLEYCTVFVFKRIISFHLESHSLRGEWHDIGTIHEDLWPRCTGGHHSHSIYDGLLRDEQSIDVTFQDRGAFVILESGCNVFVDNVSMTAEVTNGTATALQFILATLSMSTNIVNMIMETPSFVNVGKQINITVVNATIEVIHSTAFPPTALILLIASTVSIVNIVRSVADSTIVVSNCRIDRSFIPSTSSSSLNVTARKHNEKE
ncbi:Hypothetical protein, putative [Bodo saltans]|uniref:Uncharacterized protein n=1 Tax=Bodo saltans TaxID=75058 RepID=A0A0S4J8T0_BODSA|nr:Hypothetical protein, putative [Bodo saltans]|eukprot:CUG86348.1 Hypothetical protein, putative [Bodo saltans]